jgi:hypothetical protein
MTFDQWISIIGALGSLLGGVGMMFASISLVYLYRQAKAGEHSATATVYQSIVATGDSINDLFIARPELHRKLFADDGFPHDLPVSELRIRDPQLFFAATKWLDYFETVNVLWQSIPPYLHTPWKTYIADTLNGSPLMRRIILESEWYDFMRDFCPKSDELAAGENQGPGELTSCKTEEPEAAKTSRPT